LDKIREKDFENHTIRINLIKLFLSYLKLIQYQKLAKST